jgi:hypothetical protein
MIFRNYLLKLLPTLLSSLVVGLFCAQKSAGFFLYLAIPFLFGWLIYCVYFLWNRPSERISQLLKIGIWCFTLTTVFAVHQYYRMKSRQAADLVVNAVSTYHKKNGVFPSRLIDAGINLPSRGGDWRILYNLKSKEPFLFYPSTFDPFDKYFYNFTKSKWEFHPD